MLLYCGHIFKLFITLNFLNFLSLDGPPNTNFFTPCGSADPTLRTYELDRVVVVEGVGRTCSNFSNFTYRRLWSSLQTYYGVPYVYGTSKDYRCACTYDKPPDEDTTCGKSKNPYHTEKRSKQL